MQQVKVSVEEKHIDLLHNYSSYGFKDKSSLVRNAIDYFIKELEVKKLKESAVLYNEVYAKDTELKELTNSALTGWPE